MRVWAWFHACEYRCAIALEERVEQRKLPIFIGSEGVFSKKLHKLHTIGRIKLLTITHVPHDGDRALSLCFRHLVKRVAIAKCLLGDAPHQPGGQPKAQKLEKRAYGVKLLLIGDIKLDPRMQTRPIDPIPRHAATSHSSLLAFGQAKGQRYTPQQV